MKLYAPRYYKKFKCIADRCEHSCCVGWEIDIDESTLEKYKKLEGDYGAVIMDSILEEDPPHFKLGECERCPHLNDHGLCKIIINAGEEYLCDICREHPRFYNYTDVAEVGIGMSCREAARIILSFDDYATLEELGELDAEADACEFDGRADRGEIYALLAERTSPYEKRLEKVYLKYGITRGEDSYWQKKLEAIEYLDASHRNLFMNYSAERHACGADECLERFLAYLVFRHCTEAYDYENFCERLSFCLFCERLLASLISACGASTVEDIAILASIVSEEIEYSSDNTDALMFF